MSDATSRPSGGPVLLDFRNLPNDPDPQFLKEVLRGNVTFVAQQARTSVPQNMNAYLSWEEALGSRLPPRQFIEAFAACSWRGTLVRASVLAAMLANRSADQGGPEAERIIRAPLNRHRRDVNPVWARISEYVAENPQRPLAHEQVIYLIAAMAILYGRDEAPEASPEHFALMFLAGNDYLSAWSEQDSRTLSVEDGLAAHLAHVARFNTYPDPLRDLVRVRLMYSRQPPQGPLSGEPAWSEVQKKAFGSTFDEFFSTFILPLQFEIQRWGTEDGEKLVGPVIAPSRWYANTPIAEAAVKAFLDPLTTTREEAQEVLRSRLTDGVPHAPTLFIRKPFVQIDDQQVLGVSPWAVREQLKGGIYTAFSRVVNDQFDKEVWPSAFGHLFELYCRDVAQLARNSAGFTGRLVLSESLGSPDEIEDVVIVESAGCVLGSAKSRLVREDVARQARSRTALLDWYDGFFFAPKKGRYQPGALRLLDRRITDIRDGKHKDIPTNTVIVPLLITFDDLADNPMLARWLARRCREEGLLMQPNVLPAILSPIDEFEVLMALAARGMSVVELLTRFTRERERHANLNNFLHHIRQGENVRLADLEARFHEIAEATKSRLFGNSSPPAASDPG